MKTLSHVKFIFRLRIKVKVSNDKNLILFQVSLFCAKLPKFLQLFKTSQQFIAYHLCNAPFLNVIGLACELQVLDII